MARAGNQLEFLEKELIRWPGVSYEIEPSSTHPKLRLTYMGNSRFIPFSTTYVQPRGVLNKVTEMRRVLRDMGATRERE